MRQAQTCAPDMPPSTGGDHQTAPPKAPEQKTLNQVELEQRQHDVTFAHAIDIDVRGLLPAKTLRHLPVLSGLELKNEKQRD